VIARRRPDPRPTHTKLVLEALSAWPDDFATVAELMAATGSARNQTSAALHHLRKRHAVDVVIQQGTGYWYATPGYDDRTRHVDERTPEDRPRRTRRTRVTRKEA
jgi:hypothetical protein